MRTVRAMLVCLLLVLLPEGAAGLQKYRADFDVADGDWSAIAQSEDGHTFIAYCAADYSLRLQIRDEDNAVTRDLLIAEGSLSYRPAYPDIAAWSLDSCVVVWSIASPSSAGDVYYAVYSSVGDGPAGQVDAGLSERICDNAPSVCARADGEFYVTWLCTETPEEGEPIGRILLQRRSTLGQPAITISPCTPSSSYPSIACSRQGLYTIAWSILSLEEDSGIIMAYSSATGATVPIQSYPAAEPGCPSVAVSPTWGYSLIAWAMFPAMVASVRDESFNVVRPPFVTGLPGQPAPPLTADPSNNFLLAGNDQAQLYNPAGAEVGPAFAIGPSFAFSVASGKSGNYSFSWSAEGTIRSNAWRPWWTVMLYLDGDNNLSASYHGTLDEFMSDGSGDVTYLGLIDWRNATDPLQGRAVLQRERTPLIQAAYDEYEPGFNYWPSEPDMGDPETLRDFITWGMAEFPAQRYCLIMKDHGMQDTWRKEALPPLRDGMIDDSNGNTLYTCELLRALDQAGQQSGSELDVVVFDACLYAMAEIAYAIRHNATYMVASEEITFVNGFPYRNGILEAIEARESSSAALSPDDLCRILIDQFASRNDSRDSQCLSQIDLGQMEPLRQRTQVLVNDLFRYMNGSRSAWETVRDAIDDTQVFSRSASYPQDHYDLRDFCAQLDAEDSAYFTAKTAPVESALDAAIPYHWNDTDAGSSVPLADGLAIFIPWSARDDLVGSPDAYYNSWWNNGAGHRFDPWKSFVVAFCSGSVPGGKPWRPKLELLAPPPLRASTETLRILPAPPLEPYDIIGIDRYEWLLWKDVTTFALQDTGAAMGLWSLQGFSPGSFPPLMNGSCYHAGPFPPEEGSAMTLLDAEPVDADPDLETLLSFRIRCDIGEEDTCFIELSTDGGAEWNILDALSGRQEGDPLRSYRLDEAYGGSDARIRFRHVAHSLFDPLESPGGIELDDILIATLDSVQVASTTDTFWVLPQMEHGWAVWARVMDVDDLAGDWSPGPMSTTGSGAAEPGAFPERLLLSAYPNPFQQALTLRCDLSRAGKVDVAVYDLAGRRVKSIFEGSQEAGLNLFRWDGTDEGDRAVPKGIYFLRLDHDGGTARTKVLRR